MNPAVALLHLRQGNRPLEHYVQEFCELSHLVNLNDVALKDIFRVGLNEPICSRLSGGKIQWSLVGYIDHALLLSGSSFTVGIVDEVLHNPTGHTTATTTESFHVLTVMWRVIHVMPAQPETVHVMPAQPETVHVMPAQPETVHVMPAQPETVHVMPAQPEILRVMPAQLDTLHYVSLCLSFSLTVCRSLSLGQNLVFPPVALWVTVGLAVCLLGLLIALAAVCRRKIQESCEEMRAVSSLKAGESGAAGDNSQGRPTALPCLSRMLKARQRLEQSLLLPKPSLLQCCWKFISAG
ncbi:CD276 antigen [Anabarilius grahami]|uniref:CD276 antigen n=1 Tax=Anabarilius grahami TaxID=495550 RepID=A0A3N0Z425_ANAGA|nr:CD276 antigen [Anabarilius grahami]